MRATDIVLVGNRAPAVHAASQLGLSVLLVSEREPTEAVRARTDDVIVADLSTPVSDVIERAEARLRSTPRAVVALGEFGVMRAAALREAFGLPGTDIETARLASDKVTMKAAARAAGVRVTDWEALGPDSDPRGLIERLGVPLVVKRRADAGSSGLAIARSLSEAATVIEAIPPETRADWMAERHISGVEMSVESFVSGGRILFTNPTEYFVVAFANIAPAELDPDVERDVMALNAEVLRAFGLQTGMTHLELYRTADGVVFGEVAFRPPGGRIMRLIRRAYDFDPWEMLLRVELGETPVLPAAAARTGGVWMLHPGAGVVRSVSGLDATREVMGVRKLVCRVVPGDTVAARVRTGQDVGWIEVRGQSRDEVADRLSRAHAHVRIEMSAHAPEA